MSTFLSPKETTAIIKALHAWMDSQDIDPKARGLIFAKAAGAEIAKAVKDNHVFARPTRLKLGLEILSVAMALEASK